MSGSNRTEIGTHSSAPDAAAGARSSVTHDPMCPVIPPDEVFFRWGCQCDLIAKVRADERTGDFTGWISPAHHAERMRENYDFGFAAALDKARAAARWAMAEHVLAPDEETTVGLLRRIDAAIDALRGES